MRVMRSIFVRKACSGHERRLPGRLGAVAGDLLRHRHALYHAHLHSHAHCFSVRVRHDCSHARLRPACVCAV